MIADLFVRSPGVGSAILGAILGAVVYRIIIAMALSASVSTSDLKLVSALIVTAAISFPAVRDRYRLFRLRKEARRDADA